MVDMSHLSRERQREIGALVIATEKSWSLGGSTLDETIHVSADSVEWIANLDGELFRDYTAKERRRMATEGKAMPDGSFPIANCADAEKAIHAQGRAKDQAKVVSHIKKRVGILGCSGPIFDKYK